MKNSFITSGPGISASYRRVLIIGGDVGSGAVGRGGTGVRGGAGGVGR